MKILFLNQAMHQSMHKKISRGLLSGRIVAYYWLAECLGKMKIKTLNAPPVYPVLEIGGYPKTESSSGAYCCANGIARNVPLLLTPVIKTQHRLWGWSKAYCRHDTP
jgi:hypothetical protein